MLSHCRRYSLAFALVLSGLLAANGDPTPTKPTPQQIAQWVKQLGDDAFSVREKASKELWKAGLVAETPLKEALKSDDPEVVRRAREILGKFKWGIYADTPAEIVALIHAYQSTDGVARVDVLNRLYEKGPPGFRALRNISAAESDETLRKAVTDIVHQKVPDMLAKALADGKYENLEALLDLGHDLNDISHPEFTAYWLLRGKLDQPIARFRGELSKKAEDKWSAETLAYLYRVKGDMRAALDAARKSEREELVQGLLYEASDWKVLAERPDIAGSESEVEKWGYRAAYARLAGKRQEWEKAIAQLRKVADNDSDRELYGFGAAKALLLNDRPSDGLQILSTVPKRQRVLFDILCARLDYRGALALKDSPQGDDDNPQGYLILAKARTLYFLGEKDKALALFARCAENIKEGVNQQWAAALLGEEYRIGLIDLAFDHCGRLLNLAEKTTKRVEGIREAMYFAQVFPRQAATAEAWWSVLRQRFKDEPAAKSLNRLRDLLAGKIAAKDIKTWITEADQQLSDPAVVRPLAVTAATRRQAMAEIAAAAGLDELAYSLLDKADTAEALTRVGDLLAAKKQWLKAAEHYRRAWEKKQANRTPSASADPIDPLPLFLAGDALAKVGQRKEGEKLIDQSHWLPLGDAAARLTFLRALTERGFRAAARRESELLLCCAEPNSYHSGFAILRRALEAAARKDYLKAADDYEQSILRCLRLSTSFVENSAYARQPSQVHDYRARGLLMAGNYEECLQEIELALLTWPGNVDLLIAVMPGLERHGYKKNTAAIYKRSMDIYESVCQDYPRCAWMHNSAAWLAACLHRDLDKALAHARKAVELEPTTAGYLDTLAEVHFQRGEKDKAIALQKRFIELDPKRIYFRKQLRRLEAGDPSADRPVDDDE